MIHNNSLNTTKQIQSRSEKQPADIQKTLTQLQSLPSFQANSSPLMQNLLQLIQTLIQELQKETPESKEKPNTKKEGSTKQNKDNHQEQNQTTAHNPKDVIEHHNHITGTNEDDKLKGSYGDDHMLGLDGNDRLRGFQGDDYLSGGAGRDRLYGGSGNDTLVGGKGDDYLSGGQGNNVLLGGQGNDVLASRLGSDYIDGGSGQDTARIRANIDNYNITTLSQNTNASRPTFLGAPANTEGFVLKHKETGQTITVVNTENFRFNDVRLTSDELRTRIEDQNPPRLDLSASQNKNLQKLFGYTANSEKSIFVLDKDGNGKVSVGDEAIVFDNRAGPAPGSDGIFARKILSADDVKKINDTKPPVEALNLTRSEHQALSEYFHQDPAFGPVGQPPSGLTVRFEGTALDQDGNGKLSVGDIVKLRNTRSTQLEGIQYISEHVLTEKDLAEIQPNNKEIPLTNGQYERIPQLFSFLGNTDEKVSILDTDGNGKISAGDIATLGSKQVILTDATARQITTPPEGKPLKLDDAQNQQARSLFEIPSSRSMTHFITVFDSNGDGKVSKGDTVTLMKTPSIAPAVEGYQGSVMEVERISLTEAQAAQINGIKPPVEELKLTTAERQALSGYFYKDPPNGPDGPIVQEPNGLSVRFAGTVLDQDGDGKLSVGDIVKLRNTGVLDDLGVDYISDHALTEKDLATIQPNNQQLNLTKAEHKAVSNHFDRTPPIGTADGFTIRFTGVALDQNNDGKLSVGDTVKLHRTGGFAGVNEIIDHILTESDLSAIQGSNYKEIPLDSKQQKRALDLFRPFHTGGEFVRILDANGDGKVSKGDIAIHLEKPDPRPLNAEKNPEIELGRMILSEQQASVINGTALADAQKELNENKQKWEKGDVQDYSYQFRRSCFCPQDITRPVDITVQNGKVSDAQFADSKAEPPEQNQQSVNGLFAIIQDAIDKGRQVEVKYDDKTGMPTKITIDRDQMPLDGGQTITASNLQINNIGDKLELTDKQQDAIGARFNRKPPPNLFDAPTIQYTGMTIDKDGDGKLGVGDAVKLRSVGGLRPEGFANETYDHILTADDMAFIEKDRSNPLLDISKGLSNEQRQRLSNVLNVANGNIGQVFDNNSDGKLSAGDTIAISSFSSNPIGGDIGTLEFHTLTQGEIDQYLQGSDNNVKARADYDTNISKWENSRPENYSFTLKRDGNIAGNAGKPVTLTINGNTIVDARYADGTKAAVPEYNKLNINDLFKTIDKALDSNAAKVDVKYNAETGIPESIFVDQSEMMADEELYLSISNFKNLDSQNGGTLNLSDAQKKSVNSIFNIDNAAVEDNNGDGKISAGDTVTGTLFRESGTINVQLMVSADNANHINGQYGTSLSLSHDQKQEISAGLNLNDDFEGVRGVLDRDGNGKLSVGDVVYTRSNLATTGGDPIGGSSKYYHLTLDDINNIANNVIVEPNTDAVSGGGVTIGGKGHLDGVVIPDDRIVEIKGQKYSVGFLKAELNNYARSSYVPTGAVDAAFGIFDWGTSNSMAAGAAFESYIADTFPGATGWIGIPASREGVIQQIEDALLKDSRAKEYGAPINIELTDTNTDGIVSLGDKIKLTYQRSVVGFGKIDQGFLDNNKFDDDNFSFGIGNEPTGAVGQPGLRGEKGATMLD